ncbi:MAG TPA: DUF2442 domain-containing protein [Bacillota bacterium]|nr:DUF2442 domain-containing protein [Bacillota bacterium]
MIKYAVRRIPDEIIILYTFQYGGFFMSETSSGSEGGMMQMSKMLKVTPNDDYTLLVEFEHGNKIIFNMQPLINTMPYYSLNDLERFKDITIEEKAIRWPDPVPGQKSIMPVRLTVDNMLFTIRE